MPRAERPISGPALNARMSTPRVAGDVGETSCGAPGANMSERGRARTNPTPRAGADCVET
jgi:hypothetical protein